MLYRCILTQKIVSKLSGNMIRVNSSRILILIMYLPIPDPGSRRQKSKGSGSATPYLTFLCVEQTLYVGFPSAVDRVDILRAVTRGGTRPRLGTNVTTKSTHFFVFILCSDTVLLHSVEFSSEIKYGLKI
jgi:hypothetical protein